VAVIATVFLFRDSYDKSPAAALSRMSATLVSSVLCLVAAHSPAGGHCDR